MPQRIDQRKLPGLTRLYGDFLYNFESVRRFYGEAPLRLDTLLRAAARVEYAPGRRQVMADCLRRQNQAWGAGAPTQANLALFAEPGTVAVVAGQQTGVFGGPLLALYKALTAVAWARRLQAAGVNAVPIFWAATQDHDLAEVDHAWAVSSSGECVELRPELEAIVGAPVGTARLSGGIDAALRHIEPLQGPSAEALRNAYRPGAGLGDAFARYFLELLEPWGLIVFDPLRAGEAAQGAVPLYRAAAANADLIAAAIERRDAELKAAGYHAQVTAPRGTVHLFLHRDGVRHAVRRGARGFECGGETLTADELDGWIERRPNDVSPAALLRPLAQDALLPVVAQVAGPAETAYLAQASALRTALGLPLTPVQPRASVTLLDAKSRRLLSKYDAGADLCWRDGLETELARKALPQGIEHEMTQMRLQIDRKLESFNERLQALDPTLVEAAANAGQKIRHQLEQLDARVARAYGRRNDDLGRQARYLAGWIYPRRQLQERVLCVAAGLAGAGVELPRRLADALAVDDPDHLIWDE